VLLLLWLEEQLLKSRNDITIKNILVKSLFIARLITNPERVEHFHAVAQGRKPYGVAIQTLLNRAAKLSIPRARARKLR